MQKNEAKGTAVRGRSLVKWLLVMKLTAILLTVCCLNLSARGLAQEKINLSVKDVKIKSALGAIQKVSSYRFFYSDDILPGDVRVTVDAKDATLNFLLDYIFERTKLTYQLLENNVVVVAQKGALIAAPTVTGTVKFKGDSGLTTAAGIVITEQGTTRSVVTNEQGSFTIEVSSPDATLVISHVGYTTQRIPLAGRTTLDITLDPAASQLEDVVVTALGISRKKKTLTYATQEIKGTELSDGRPLNVSGSMVGRVAGMTLNKTNSGPGGSNRIVFRGNRSISGNNQPMIVVDGVRIDNDSKAVADVALFGARDNGDGISNINPDDIASMTVLTGASASALYGSDAANGVILITTKTGRIGKGVGVSVSSSYTFEKPMITPDFQNEYGQGDAGVYLPTSENSWGPKMSGQALEDWTGKTQPYSAQPDNYKDYFRTGSELLNSVSLSGGTAMAQTYFSFTNALSKGIIPNNDFRRNNLNLRQTLKMTDKLSLDVKATYVEETIKNRPLSGAGNRIMSTLVAMPRSLRLDDIKDFETTDPDGTLTQNYWASPGPSYQNPYWSAYRNLYERKRNRIIGLAALKYQFLPGLSLQVRSSVDYYTDNSEEKDYNNTFWLTDYPGQGNYILNKETNRQFNNDVLLNFSKDLTPDLSLVVNAGASIEQFKFTRATLNNQGLNAPNIFSTSNAVSLTNQVNSYLAFIPISRTEKQSVYAAAQLGYKNALFLDLTGRNDWNSTLSPQNASYFFPSAGVSAVMNELLNLPAAISFLKLRSSYAFVGNGTGFNQLKPSYQLVAGGNNGFVNIDRTLRNYNLKPEKTRSFEAGIEMGLINNRIGFEFTYYKTNSRNQVLTIPVPEPSGYANRIINAGNIQNQGVEALLRLTPVQSGQFKWNTSFTFGANKNKVIKLDSLQPMVPLTSGQSWGAIVVKEGEAYGQLYSSSVQRDDAGRVIVSANGLPLLNSEQDFLVGNVNPDFTAGMTNTFSYGAWSFSFLVDMRKGGKFISGTQGQMAQKGTSEQTLQGREGGFIVPNSVFEDGTKNSIAVSAQDYWLWVAGNSVGELFSYSATNIRMREVLLGYNFPAGSTGKFFKGANISLVGRNLFFFKNNKFGIDPESSLGTGNNQGIEYSSIPSTRSLGVFLKFNF
ncbi:MAG: SusC/RagA family TonB-linked outer membrane protein [Chitinophagaceae bacterium]|nr:MAG: SusC/RagA family TonB-linked outer membrane protein [Chitinophagaceae bacterium]